MNILHVFREPVGGLFRHVRDLARGQALLGHRVGLICDSETGGAAAEALLATALPFCALGIHRMAIPRLPGPGDISIARRTKALAGQLHADVIHGHGAKGGLYSRLAALGTKVPSYYTPHGGSLHYNWLGFPGFLYLATEWALARVGSGQVFVCNFERDVFARKIGLAGKPHIVVHNGLWPEEFKPVTPSPDAADIVFMGEMRRIKGVDTLLEAIAIVAQQGPVTACLVGDGPELATFQAQAEKLGLSVTFPGRLPTREGLARGKLLVVPSRAESFPYIVLEAAAAEIPMLVSAVGGVPEVLPEDMMSPPGDARALARRIALARAAPDAVAAGTKALARDVAKRFVAEEMARRITGFYAAF
jgi:glycosyltransferase involved in cell wall biosynthesis